MVQVGMTHPPRVAHDDGERLRSQRPLKHEPCLPTSNSHARCVRGTLVVQAVRQGAAPHHHLLLSRRWAAAAGPDVSAAKAAAAQQKASPDTVLPAPAHHAAPPPPVPMHTPTSHWSGRFVGDAKFMKSAQDVDLGSFALSCADATSIADVTRWPTQLRAVLFALKDKIPQILPRCSRSAQVYGISLTPKGKEVITSLLKHGFAMMLDTGVQGSGHIGVFLEPSAGGQRSRLVAHWEGA